MQIVHDFLRIKICGQPVVYRNNGFDDDSSK